MAKNRPAKGRREITGTKTSCDQPEQQHLSSRTRGVSGHQECRPTWAWPFNGYFLAYQVMHKIQNGELDEFKKVVSVGESDFVRCAVSMRCGFKPHWLVASRNLRQACPRVVQGQIRRSFPGRSMVDGRCKSIARTCCKFTSSSTPICGDRDATPVLAHPRCAGLASWIHPSSEGDQRIEYETCLVMTVE